MEERQEPIAPEVSRPGTTAEETAEVAAAGPTPESPEEELARLRRELEEAKARAAEYLDGWQRTQAEFSNYRKRQEAEFLQRVQMNNAVLIARILPVLDDLERAVQTLPPGLQTLTWVDGIFLIKRKLEAILEMEGVRPIETAGKSFDPLYHEAVTYEEASNYEDGQIIGEVQRGYMLGDRVLRPALVRVARAPAPQGKESEG
jgi:molecular chaperone GrpE